MVRAKIWFRCAVVHDPVTPKVVQPAVIGWEAKFRRIDLVIERTLKGEELVRRMKGWITVDPNEVIDTVRKYGKLKVVDDWELVVDMESMDKFSGLQKACSAAFGDQVDLDLVNE
ncbi:MAG: hypothetical protein P8105_04930 [Dehalococcoidia bacterium]